MSLPEEEIENSLKKLRRRIEHYLRNTTPQKIIEIAKLCGIEISQKLINKFLK
jgi:hypothetical protein